MKQRLLLIFTLLFISMGAFSQNTRAVYESNWEKVREFEKNSLPQSAISEVHNILKMAIKEGNVPQIAKAYVNLEMLEAQIDSHGDYGTIAKLDSLLKSSIKQEDKALLNALLADMYLVKYERDRWNIVQRTSLNDVVPDDINEWSVNIFEDKIAEHLKAAVKDKSSLLKSTTQSYTDIIDLGKDSRKYHPTLYDFVMLRVIETSKSLVNMGYESFDVSETGVSLNELLLTAKKYTSLKFQVTNRYLILSLYQKYMNSLVDRGLTSTLIEIELDKYRFITSESNRINSSGRLEALFALEKEYTSNEASVEIVDAITSELQERTYLPYRVRFVNSYSHGTVDDVNGKIYTWLTETIKKYPNYARIAILNNKLQQLEQPEVVLQANSLYYNGDKVDLTLTYQNVQKLDYPFSLNLYKVVDDKEILQRNLPLNLTSKTSYNSDTTKLELGKLPFGKYILREKLPSTIFDEDKKEWEDNNKYEFIVSDLMSYTRSTSSNSYEIFVVSRRNGKPVKGANVVVYKSYYQSSKKGYDEVISTLTTNNLGMVVFEDTRTEAEMNKYGQITYKVVAGADKDSQHPLVYLAYYNGNYNEVRESVTRNTISIFADRSIYRPGQQVQMKAIVLDKSARVVANDKQILRFYNPNGDIVSEQTLLTNEFGSVSTSFAIPQTGLLGYYRITVNDEESLYIDVEEYKRPTFEVNFDKIEKTYSFGEKVTLQGTAKTFSGISLQHADVNFRVARRPFSLWYWNPGIESHFADGVVQTKEDGSFEIEFTPESADVNNILGRNIYTFSITANVTDINGETQSNVYTMVVGEQSMILDVQLPNSQIEKSSDIAIKILAKNLDAVDIETSGTYAVYTFDKDGGTSNKVLEGSFVTGEQKELATQLKKLESGKYQIQVIAKDNKGKDVKGSSDFVLYSYLDKKPPFETDSWLIEKESTFKSSNPVEVIYGTSRKDAYILYQIYNNNKVFERKFIQLSDANKLFKVAYKAEFGDQVYMSFTNVDDGKLTTKYVLLKKEEEKKEDKLKIKFDVFRDKLRPGQEETWTMSIRDQKDQIVDAEVLASMYDMSLDQIKSLASWSLTKPSVYKEYLRQQYFNTGYFDRSIHSSMLHYKLKLVDIPAFDFDRWSILPNSVVEEVMTIGYGAMSRKSVPGAGRISSDSVLQESVVASPALSNEPSDEVLTYFIPEQGGAVAEAKPQVRRNFNETAFFFPQLKTNAKGETVISFTVPESNTTWRFRALAHSKDSKVGELEKMVVTRKELMVTPNMPRFVRQGDKTSISTKISNLSENAIAGTVHLEFFNPLDDQLVDLGIAEAKQNFELKKDASSSATWTFDVPKDYDMLGVRIVASSESFSDGEQLVLAVLPNRMLVTETMPIDILDKGQKEYTLGKFVKNTSKTLENYKLTFEFASNPSWYAVQALPVLSNPTNDNAVNWFASYYVNTLGASLMSQYPKLAKVIEAWKMQDANKQTLVSKLTKDQELKAILLEETPWVMDAKSETEQMERLSLLFDLNSTNYKTNLALDKLGELKSARGGWSWYKGMNGSRSITQYILYGFANLQHVGMVEHPGAVKYMQMDALKYIDECIAEDFAQLKKSNKLWKETKSISTNQLEYLYVRAMYRDIPISHEARVAERFYTEVVSKNWTKLGLYEKSLLAVLLPQLGEKELAQKVAASIKEHAVTRKENGMYWPNNRAKVFLSQSAVSVHVFLMEAMKANGATDAEMNNMKRWLVKQKQTQIWESTHATIDAIGALLQYGDNWLDSEATPTIKVGSEIVKPVNTEVATGYFKTSWTASEIKSDMGKVTINSQDDKPAYGSLYWQYYEDLNKITQHNGILNVSKELYKEVVDASGKSLVKITAENPLKVGDKVIVRLVVRSDRDMEFVQLKDMRASCFEPVNTTSGMMWQNSVAYYQATKDASTNFFFDVLPKGTYVFEYAVYVNRVGEYSNGITSLQSAYAPEFSSHTSGIKVVVK